VSTELAALENFGFALLNIVKTTELRYSLLSKGLNWRNCHDVNCYECNCEPAGIVMFVRKYYYLCAYVFGVVGLVVW